MLDHIRKVELKKLRIEKETHSLIIIIVILFELTATFGIIYPNSPPFEHASWFACRPRLFTMP